MLITRQNNPLSDAAGSGIDLFELARQEGERRKGKCNRARHEDGKWTLEDFRRAHEYTPRLLKLKGEKNESQYPNP